MAIAIKLSNLRDEQKNAIIEKCCVKPTPSQYDTDPQPVVCFASNSSDGLVYVPVGIWKSIYPNFPNRNFPPSKARSTKIMYTKKTDPKGYRDQDVVVKESLSKLSRDHTVFIACSTGYGKTSIGAHLTCYLGLKAAILCHIDKVNDQWVDEYKEFTTAKVQRVKGNVSLDPTADVYVIGIMKASKMSREDFKDIGTVVLDEAHIATITAFRTTLLKFRPKYVIGLSATPKRADGMHKLIHMFFGPKSNFIVREERKSFEVYKIETPYKPKISYRFTASGPTIDWSGLVNSLAYNSNRQDYIVSLVLKHPNHRIMILSDRQNECKSIYDKLAKKDEHSVLLLTGEVNTKGVKTSDYRVLVAGMKKAGVGFNDPTLTMLILATDVKNVIQQEGRIRTTDNIIYDLVDDYSTLEKHWDIRKEWYLHRGATIKTINLRQTTSFRLMA